MATIHFATNRNLVDGATPNFGTGFNAVHPQSLRYGEFSIAMKPTLARPGTGQADELTERIDDGEGQLTVYPENLATAPPLLGSDTLYGKLKPAMQAGTDTLVYVHGFNVSFAASIAYGLVLQERLNLWNARQQGAAPVQVVCFTWPSDGKVTKYLSDRDDAAASGLAFSRAFQRLAGFLRTIREEDACQRHLHLLCHSMGNYVLENTLWHLADLGKALPRVFREVVLAAADVDSDAFETTDKLGRVHELGQRISVYFNRGDLALTTSDTVKGNPDRLGQTGPKHPLDVPTGTVNIDCSSVVGGTMEHSYYLDEAFRDLAATLHGVREDEVKKRTYVPSANAYRLG